MRPGCSRSMASDSDDSPCRCSSTDHLEVYRAISNADAVAITSMLTCCSSRLYINQLLGRSVGRLRAWDCREAWAWDCREAWVWDWRAGWDPRAGPRAAGY